VLSYQLLAEVLSGKTAENPRRSQVYVARSNVETHSGATKSMSVDAPFVLVRV